MSKKMLAAAFVSGAAIGVLASYTQAKNKYEKLYQEELESVKETYSKFDRSDKNADDSPPVILENVYKAAKDASNAMHNATMPSEEYSDELRKLGYSNDEVDDKDKPYIIPPEEFGEFEDYDCISLTYYSDGVLAERDHEIVEDIDETIGEDNLTHFGEYEDDSVFVRNDKLKADYEILRDYRKYTDVTRGLRPYSEGQ